MIIINDYYHSLSLCCRCRCCVVVVFVLIMIRTIQPRYDSLPRRGRQEPQTIGSETMQNPLLFTSRVHRTDRLPPLTPELFTGIL